MPDNIFRINGFGFDPDALTARFAAACAARGITSRAQFLAAWQAATAAQQIMFLAQMIFGSVRFPEDPDTLTSQQLATLGTP